SCVPTQVSALRGRRYRSEGSSATGAVAGLALLLPLGGRRRVQYSRGADERFECLFVDLVALMQIDRAPGVAFEARVEETGRVLERGSLEKGQLHDGLVRLAGANDAIVLPHRNPPPLPLFDD